MTKKSSMERKRRIAKQADMETQRKAEGRRRILSIVGVIVGVIAVSAVVYLLFFDQEEDLCAGDETRVLTDLAPAERNNYYSTYPEYEIDTSKEYEACIRTENGNIRLRLFAEQAPLTVNNFVFLAEQGFYDGTTFHRIIEDFMAQAGDPTGTGMGGPGYDFEDEVSSGLTFDRGGLLAMANSGPATNGSQFFITYEETPWLNGLHTIFGEIIEGEDVLNALAVLEPDPSGTSSSGGDGIERINVIER
jgi:cyclophilin family peptidyl-prolyl cis-trans isomerase